MLRFIFLLILVAFSSSLLCQQPDRPVLSLTYLDHWDPGTNDWVRNQRINYTYDESLNQTEAIYYSQSDSEPGGWINQLRFVYSYDAEGNRTMVIHYYWDSQSNNWVNNSRFTYTYDVDGNQIDFRYSYWDTQGNNWLSTSRETVTYGEDQRRTGGSFYSWDPKLRNWFNYKYYTTNYDSEMNLLDARYYHRDGETSDWTTDGHVYFEYDEDGNRTKFESHYIDPATNDWQPNLRVNEAYDEAGNRTEGLYYRFHSLTNDWTAHWRYVYSYDPDGNRTEEVNYHWNSNTNSWVNDLRNLTSIDGNGNPEEEVHYVWDSGSNTWENLKKVEHVWSDTVTIIPDTTSQSCGPCQNMTFTDPAGSLSDNSCDGEYENFADCRKLIQVSDAEYIYLVFTEFNIEEGYDFVRVYDGPTTGHPLLGEYTGTSVPGPITSSQGVMLIHFTSDYSEIRSGWSAEYTSGEDPVCFNETFTEESGILDDNSGDGDYMINADCQKLIMPEDVLNITLTFTEFVLEDGYDYVRVYDGPTTGDELLGEFTGTSLPASVTSSGSSMLLHFTSDGGVNASGWAASYTSIPSLCGPCQNETFTEQAGSLSDNSCDGEYDNFADCRKLIQVPGADYIDLMFTEFDIESNYDYVRVYDGPTTGDDLLGEFTGTSLPGSITSSQGTMLIHFISDRSVVSSGWSAEYTAGSLGNICVSETFTAESGIVDDNSGDGDYMINAYCQKLIMPEDVLNITLTFTEFVLEDGYDYVRVYDGPTTGDILLGEFTGTSLPASLTSSGGSMLIHFTSNGSVNASGWAASYTSIPSPCGPCLDETFTEQAGSLSDNSCDGEYDNFADCRKLIQVTDADYINLVFTEFNIQEGNDYVRVYDGPTTDDALLGEFTGTSLPGSITSSQGSMLVHFTSDQGIVSSGWSAEYAAGSLGSICVNETFTAESGSVDDNSGDGDYRSNAYCQKLIMPEDVLNITLTFTEFVLENLNDFVRIYDGPTTGDELIGEFTGTTLPPSLTSSGGSILILFTSNGSVNASGWAASYTSTPSPCGPCLDETFTNQTGSFSDNSCDGEYDNNADCRKLIQVPGAEYINLVFTEFNIQEGNDYVRVYDGPTTDDALLGEFSGTSLPGSITSSQSSMLVHFTSDGSEVRSGWSAEYSAGNFGTICVSEILTAESGIVDDNSGDKDYLVHADCQKLIMPENVSNITLTFTEFALEEGNDFIRVYDGSTSGDELLGEFTGTTMPESLTSSGGSMMIHFTSNSSVNASGWAFSYTSIAEIPDTTTVTAIPDGTMQPGRESILVYPNPVTNHVTVEISNNSEISKIEVFDLYGRMLRIKDNISSNSVTLQRGNLKTGIYILKIHAADTHTRKIFIW